MHRIGGIEKEDGSGNISYEPDNHQAMVRLRAERIALIAHHIPPVEVIGDPDASVAVVGWGSTWGAITSARRRLESAGHRLAHIHLRHLNPLPANLGTLLGSFERVVVPEMNTGQLCRMLRAEFLVDARSVTKVSGQPFTAAELVEALWEEIGEAGEKR